MTEKVSLEDEVARSVDARHVLNNYLFKEAVDKVQADIFDRFASSDPAAVMELQIQRLRLKALSDIVRQLQTVMETGELAKVEIERQRTVAARMVERMKRGIRGVA